MKNLIVLLSLVAGFNANAGIGKSESFICKVNGFDNTNVQVACDGGAVKNMKLPRKWLSEEEMPKVGAPIKFALDESQIKEWAAMNKPVTKKGNKK